MEKTCVVLVVVVLLLAAGCAGLVVESGLDIGDGGFLSGEPCEPPCFFGIEPGVTTEAEAIEIFYAKAQELLQQCEVKKKSNTTQYIFCHGIGSIYFQEGTNTVRSIQFRPSSAITLEEVIGKYGEPDAVSVTASGIPENCYTLMNVYYDDIQTKLFLGEQNDAIFQAKSSTVIDIIYYYDTASYKSAKSPPLSDWNGYGDYEQQRLKH